MAIVNYAGSPGTIIGDGMSEHTGYYPVTQ
jgi:hypothetical protein